MRPYLMLLFAAFSLAAVKPAHAQKKEHQATVFVNKAAVDTGIVSVTISWYGYPCSFAQVNILPAGQPGASPIASKMINTMGDGCFNSVAFGGITAGTEITVEVIISTGFRAYSAPGYVHAGWPPLSLEVSFPH
jgi:hypothetical protein